MPVPPLINAEPWTGIRDQLKIPVVHHFEIDNSNIYVILVFDTEVGRAVPHQRRGLPDEPYNVGYPYGNPTYKIRRGTLHRVPTKKMRSILTI